MNGMQDNLQGTDIAAANQVDENNCRKILSVFANVALQSTSAACCNVL